MQAIPDVSPVQQAAAGDNAVSFMQIREHQIEAALPFCAIDGRIKLARAPGEFRQFAPRFAAAVGDDLIIQSFRQRIIADVAQGKKYRVSGGLPGWRGHSAMDGAGHR